MALIWVCTKIVHNFIKNFSHDSGQIMATSRDLTSKGSCGREIPLFHGNLGLVKYDSIWPDD